MRACAGQAPGVRMLSGTHLSMHTSHQCDDLWSSLCGSSRPGVLSVPSFLVHKGTEILVLYFSYLLKSAFGPLCIHTLSEVLSPFLGSVYRTALESATAFIPPPGITSEKKGIGPFSLSGPQNSVLINSPALLLPFPSLEEYFSSVGGGEHLIFLNPYVFQTFLSLL